MIAHTSFGMKLWLLSQLAVVTVFQALLIQMLMQDQRFPFPMSVTFYSRLLGALALGMIYAVAFFYYQWSMSGRARSVTRRRQE